MTLHGLVALDRITWLKPNQAKDLVKDFQSKYPAQGLGILVRNNLTGLIWWAKDKKHCQLPLLAAEIDANILYEGMVAYKTYLQNKEKEY